MSRARWYSTSSGRIELRVHLRDARPCSHPGPCDADVTALRARPYIAQQLARIDPALLAAELAEWGVWDATERAEHSANLDRLLWLACCDIVENEPCD